MFKNIFFKEFLKLRFVIIVLSVVHFGVIAYAYLKLRSMYMGNDPVTLWLHVVGRDYFYFGLVSTALSVSALWIGIQQFYSEVEKKRFRISCHLPLSETKVMLSIVSFGVGLVVLFGLADMALLSIAVSQFFPSDIIKAAAVVMLNYTAGAVMLYFTGLVLTLEPEWKHKLLLAFILLPVTTFVFQPSVYNDAPSSMLMSFILLLITAPVVLFPAYRFRKGAGI